MYLSIIFNSAQQTTSVISHILPVYQSSVNNLHKSLTTAVLSLLHFLVAGYPSQNRYFQHLHSLPRSLLPPDSSSGLWLRQMSHALRSRNYARFEHLTNRAACEQALPTGQSHGDIKPWNSAGARSRPSLDLSREALCTLVENLRTKARESNWLVLRSAYREWTLPTTADAAPGSTREWLIQSLALRSVVGDRHDSTLDIFQMLDDWIERRRSSGDVRPKEGVEGRWVVNKPKV